MSIVRQIYTIGHSSHVFGTFLSLLQKHVFGRLLASFTFSTANASYP